jgi:MoxR-like ATPase
MRLLHFVHPDRLVLTDFHGKSIPQYAILSHRWGGFEILLEDIGSGAYKEKKDGYRKLQFCAEQAAQDKLQYFWIDTCCIDKWNLWERSRAINSMFLWYKNATRCYVFLSDVSVPTATKTLQRSSWETSFRASAWFTRGRTLQELIAPVSVEFFSCEGWQIGDKMSLDQLVHEITTIPLAALRNDPLDEFTISERARWSENRKTTEEEDIVYCLLGVLGVSMPTSYGEGKESASRRLQAEIEAANSAPCIIPFSQNDRFRELQLAKLEAKIFGDRQSTRLAIVGPRGTGKSQLALEVAHRTRQKNKNSSVFWVDASNKDSLYQSYASIAQKLSVPGWNDEKADVTLLVKRYLVGSSARQCLLIFDNAGDIPLESSGSLTARAVDLFDYLPQSELCSIIFTTTSSNTARTLASQNIIELRELEPDLALRMLDNYLSTPISQIEQREAKLLLQELSYLPLAIVQAAAYMNVRNITLEKYRAELARHIELAFKHSNDAPDYLPQGSNAKSPVAATLGLSLDEIRRSNALPAEYLFLAACITRKDIPLDLLVAPSIRAREDAVKVLSKYALVTRRPAESALDLHGLVHHALREWLKQQGWLRKWTQQAITQLLWLFPDDGHINRSKWRRLLPHTQYALMHSAAEDDNEERLDLVQKCATTLYSDGRYEEAEGLEVQVIEIRKRVLGDEHPDTLASIANLASTYRKQGRWKESEVLGVQVIGVMKRVLGDEHPDTLASIGSLASTYGDQGRWKEAEALEVQVMGMMKRVLGDEHPDTLISLANLASTYKNQGRWKEAEELEVQVIEVMKKVLGDEHPDTVISLGSLALTYKNQGRWKEAEELGVQVMGMMKKVLGDEHPDTLASIANLASTYRKQGRWIEAEELEVQEIEMTKRVLGDEHPNTLASMASLVSTYWNQGRWKEAEELEVQVMETRKRVLGDEHPDTLASMANLASTYWDQGQWKEAFALMETCFQRRKQIHGEQHPYTQSSLNILNDWRAESSEIDL